MTSSSLPAWPTEPYPRPALHGHYAAGFETSSFTPRTPFQSFAGTAYEEIARGSAWVTFTNKANRQTDSKWPRGSWEQEYPPIFVRWRATVTGPGGYGHMGVSMYDMLVTEVLEMRRSAPSDCQQ